jgi:hypothetical protein
MQQSQRCILWEPLSHSKSYSVRRTRLKTSSTMSSFVLHAHHCRRNLAFFLSLADEPAQWLCITQSSNTNSSSTIKCDCLSKLLGMSYFNMYVPFMRHCGLICKSRSKKYSNNITLQPAIEGNFYTWSDFIAEYSLCIETETTFVRYFVRVGKFRGKAFTVVNQPATKFKYNTIRDRQRLLISSVAADDSVSLLSPERPMTISPADSTFLQQQEDVYSSSYVDSNYCSTTNSDMDMNNYNSLSSLINFKNIIQMHFFEKIMRDGTKYSDIWRLISEAEGWTS